MGTPVRRALLSVSDKSGLPELAQFLASKSVEILSTGGTARSLHDAGLAVVEVSEHTGFPEILDGRVKTLHPRIHGGILNLRDEPTHRAAVRDLAIEDIDLVVVNLYPFEETVASGAALEACIENIDIGGPSLIRAAAKNHRHVTVVVDPADYQAVMDQLAGGGISSDLRRRLAAKAFACTAAYDAAIGTWMDDRWGTEEKFPPRLIMTASLNQRLRYGENPHQDAALYSRSAGKGLANAVQLQGKALSYNNLNDADSAVRLVNEFDHPAAVIVKHANPCGVAIAEYSAEAYRKALSCDPKSAYGGIIALNRPLDSECASEIVKTFVEVVIAPETDEAAREIFAQKRNLRLLSCAEAGISGDIMLRAISGGYLAQTPDDARTTPADLRVVTRRQPTEAELADLLFAFTVCKFVSSNAIVLARNGATTGIGAGQMSRVDAAHIAVSKCSSSEQSVVASDAFFPFPDALQAAIDGGATAAIQPGGSKGDDAVIAAADEAGIAMVFTGRRHFRH